MDESPLSEAEQDSFDSFPLKKFGANQGVVWCFFVTAVQPPGHTQVTLLPWSLGTVPGMLCL